MWVWGALMALAVAARWLALHDIPYTLWVDETWLTYRAREILAGVAVWPTADPWFASGNSPYHTYLAALVQALGVTPAYASRWVGAASGVLAVALMWPVMHAALPVTAPRAWAGVLAVALLAPLFTSLIYSRDGGQGISSMPWTMLALLAAYFATERLSWRWAVGAGAALMVSQTTYESTLAVPLMLAGWWLWRLAACPGQRLTLLKLGGIAAGVALTLYAPLLYHYARHPEVVFTRLQATSDLATSGWPALLAKLPLGWWQALWGFVGLGDKHFGHNWPYRPMFDPLLATGLVIGLGVAVTQARRQPGAAWLLLWLGVGLVPAAVTADTPSFTRLLLAVPAALALSAWGLLTAWMWFSRWPRAATLLLVIGVTMSGANSLWRYFGVWLNDPRLFDARGVGIRQVVDSANALSQHGDVWLTTQHNPYVFYSYAIGLKAPSARAFDAGPACFPWPNRAPRAVFFGVVPAYDTFTTSALAARRDPEPAAVVMHPAGYAHAVFWRVPAHTPAPALPLAPAATLADALKLTGAAVPEHVRAGETFTVTLDWQSAAPLTAAPTVFVHVGRAGEPLITQRDAPLCPAIPIHTWQADYVYRTQHALTMPETAAPGAYEVYVGGYDPTSGARWPITTAAAPVLDNRVHLFTLAVIP